MSASKVERGLPSRYVTEGLNTALNRIYFHAMGLSQDDLERPIIGVASAWDGASASGSMPLRGATKAQGGVWAAGGMPRQFATIADDVVAESLVGRELIADSVELTVRGHSYDGLLGVTSSVAGMAGLLMVMCRLDVPAALVPLVGPAVESGADALSLAAAAHELGLAAPLPDPLPAGLEPLLGPAHAAGGAVMAMLDAGRSARSGVTAESLERAAAAIGRSGGNPDLILHLLAIANECGVDVDPAALAAAVDAAAEPGVRWCGGSLASDGALLVGDPTLAALDAAARVFDDPDEALEFAASGWAEGTAIVVRGVGPVGGPGAPRLDRLLDGLADLALPAGAALITDGRLRPLPGLLAFSCVGPEAAADGPLAALRDGDRIAFSPEAATLDAEPTGSQRAAEPPWRSARLEKYAAVVGPASAGAVTHPGARAETVRYLDL
jgi:dihydroxyacid dehydratase/phosphogluconate dehydratase